MELQKIKDQLIEKLSNNDKWLELLSDTTPGNYGINTWDVGIDESHLYVDIPNRTFSFKKIEFTADVVLGASKGEDSIDQTFTTSAKGKGTFKFLNKDNVEIEELEIEADMDIFK